MPTIRNYEQLSDEVDAMPAQRAKEILKEVVRVMYEDHNGDLDGAKDMDSDTLGELCNIMVNEELAPEELI